MRLLFHLHTRRTRPLVMLAAVALAAICLTLTGASGTALARTSAKPTIVLVHGAFADASGFGAVTDRLQHRGYTVICPANPLRGPAYDAASVTSVLKTIDGPIVLVAHSYGGAVITEAATQVSNVKALVYLNALALDEGESNLDITSRFPNHFFDAVLPRPFSQPDGTQGTDLYIDPVRFRAVFAPDVPARKAAQRRWCATSTLPRARLAPVRHYRPLDRPRTKLVPRGLCGGH